LELAHTERYEYIRLALIFQSLPICPPHNSNGRSCQATRQSHARQISLFPFFFFFFSFSLNSECRSELFFFFLSFFLFFLFFVTDFFFVVVVNSADHCLFGAPCGRPARTCGRVHAQPARVQQPAQRGAFFFLFLFFFLFSAEKSVIFSKFPPIFQAFSTIFDPLPTFFFGFGSHEIEEKIVGTGAEIALFFNGRLALFFCFVLLWWSFFFLFFFLTFFCVTHKNNAFFFFCFFLSFHFFVFLRLTFL
jgi:hypothetical protein